MLRLYQFYKKFGLLKLLQRITRLIHIQLFITHDRIRGWLGKQTTLKKLPQQLNTTFITQVYNDPSFQQWLPHNSHSLLQSVRWPNSDFLRWHSDFLTCTKPRTWYNKSGLPFFTDIQVGTDNKEIKVAWEASRLQHLTLQALDKQNHVQAWEKLESWLQYNPYQFGINWICCMEVSIRAINMLWITELTSLKLLNTKLFNRVCSSLQEHLNYLEKYIENWPVPNNHYLTDLVALFYLKIFLKEDENELKKLQLSIEHQFQAHLLADGTLNEGSSAYHRLATELYLHFHLLCKHLGFTHPQQHTTLNRMLAFYNACCTTQNSFLQIGDNDSGKLVFGLAQAYTDKGTLAPFHFAKFGLAGVQGNTNFISLRSCNFTDRQPSGHFHQDDLSLSLTWSGQPVFVDPGTGAYTGNPRLRQSLRSYSNHTTFGPLSTETSHLFFLPPTAYKSELKMQQKHNTTQLSAKSWSNKYTVKREVQLVHNKTCFQEIEILDSYDGAEQALQWHFILHPNIAAKISPRGWILSTNDITLEMITPLKLQLEPAVFSEHFLHTQPTKKLAYTLNGKAKFKIHTYLRMLQPC